MKTYSGTIIDTAGNVQAGQAVYVYFTGTSVLASLQQNGVGVGNPITTGSDGRFSFDVGSGTYDFKDVNGNLLQSKVQIYDLANPSEWLNASTVSVNNVLSPYVNVEQALEAVLLGNVDSQNTAGTILPAGVTLVGGSMNFLSKRFSLALDSYNLAATTSKFLDVANGLTFTFPPRTVIFGVTCVITQAFICSGATTWVVTINAKLPIAGPLQNITSLNPQPFLSTGTPNFLGGNVVGASWSSLAPTNAGQPAYGNHLPAGGTLALFVTTLGTGLLNTFSAGAIDLTFYYGVGK